VGLVLTHELRLGRWQDVLADVERCDVILTDPPYSERTHAGFRSGAAIEQLHDGFHRNRLAYEALATTEAVQFVERWSPVVGRWSLIFGDNVSTVGWSAAWGDAGWVTFAPLAWLKRAAAPRMSGDGPCSAVEYVAAARPRRRTDRHHGSTPGYYETMTVRSYLKDNSNTVIGTKDVAGLKRILYDYSRPGDLILDCFAGTATVGQACIETGRSYIGAEMDPKTYALGMKRLKGSTPCLPGLEPDRWRDDPAPEQTDLFG